MSDIATTWDAARGRGDWAVSGGQLQDGDDLATAVLLSLFTDRVAASDDVIADGSGDPRGWWGDTGQAYPVGSRLWMLERAKQTQETAARAKDYIAEALRWLVDDGVVGRFDLTVEWVGPGRLGARVVAHKPDGSTLNLAYAWTWNGIS